MPNPIPMFPGKQAHSHRLAPSPLPLALGVALALTGVALMAEVLYAIYGVSPEADRLSMQLGLGGAALLSGLSQIALLIGLWLIWRSFKRSA